MYHIKIGIQTSNYLKLALNYALLMYGSKLDMNCEFYIVTENCLFYITHSRTTETKMVVYILNTH